MQEISMKNTVKYELKTTRNFLSFSEGIYKKEDQTFPTDLDTGITSIDMLKETIMFYSTKGCLGESDLWLSYIIFCELKSI